MTALLSCKWSLSIATRLFAAACTILFAGTACGAGGLIGSTGDDALRVAVAAAQLAARNADEAARVVANSADDAARVQAITVAEDAIRTALAASDEVARAGGTVVDDAAWTSAANLTRTIMKVQFDLLAQSHWDMFLADTQRTLGAFLSSEEVDLLKGVFQEVACGWVEYELDSVEFRQLMADIDFYVPRVGGIPGIDALLLNSAAPVKEDFSDYVADHDYHWALSGADMYCELL